MRIFNFKKQIPLNCYIFIQLFRKCIIPNLLVHSKKRRREKMKKFSEFVKMKQQELKENLVLKKRYTPNKKLVFVKDDHINGKVPSGFSYVYFDFNMRKGLAHVIENQRRFKPEFARGLIAECLNVEVLFLRRKVSSVSMTLLQTEYQGRLKRFIERSRD